MFPIKHVQPSVQSNVIEKTIAACLGENVENEEHEG